MQRESAPCLCVSVIVFSEELQPPKFYFEKVYHLSLRGFVYAVLVICVWGFSF